MQSPDFDVAAVAAELQLKPKLAKRLLVLAKGHRPWREAMKKHQQLVELKVIHEGTDGTEDVAVISADGILVAKELHQFALREKALSKLTSHERELVGAPGPWPRTLTDKLSAEERTLLHLDDLPF